ncbi:hypothetical protein [Bradyrhizobium cytisi]|uniref:Uncharacterized protein n=1 Tax=Bradyrhizobium cytisi TaxID=515489 RepID=A0A5S4VUR7_9BRAD|nr:hypothetical protein [Bradyrhizobium cytisi]TYL70268.1 hypothetical protein FXB38_41910 [Bradyrhizobium cytisi]
MDELTELLSVVAAGIDAEYFCLPVHGAPGANSELDESWDKSAIAYGQVLLIEHVLQTGIDRTIGDLYLSFSFEFAG